MEEAGAEAEAGEMEAGEAEASADASPETAGAGEKAEAAVGDARAEGVGMVGESHRRPLTLPGRLRARLFLCLDEDRGWKRYPLSIRKTLAELRRSRGKTV